MNIFPRAIAGPWKAGFTLDAHTVSSEFLGYNQQGHAIYDTVRSELGELLYRLKYESDQSTVPRLARAVAEFILSKTLPIDVVVPLPPSKQRSAQPVALIAKSVAKRMEIAYDSKALKKVKESPELKSMTDLKERRAALADAFAASAEALQGKSVLICIALEQAWKKPPEPFASHAQRRCTPWRLLEPGRSDEEGVHRRLSSNLEAQRSNSVKARRNR